MSDSPRRAVFLDRDGTIMIDRHYLADPAGVDLLPGAAAALARLNAAGVPAVLVTNQSGIGRGYFTEAQYQAVHARLIEVLAAGGARLDAEYHCGEPPDPEPGFGCRKPGGAMFEQAAREHGYDLSTSWYVGDRLRDVIPARTLGGRAVIVRSPETETEEAEALDWITVVDRFDEAVDLVFGAGATQPGDHEP